MSLPLRAAIVIPCFNEEQRLADARFVAFAQLDERLDLIFVDDGSRDRTIDVLERMRAQAPDKVSVLPLPKNVGKGEAVRQGMQSALARTYDVIGYADADLATPPEELFRMLEILGGRPDLDIAVASRVLMIGRRIHREARRHYLGRVFATFASRILAAPFYDTQCGAKIFRVTPALSAALDAPFVSRWAFDVEILGRLIIGTKTVAGVPLERFLEIPLEEWIDKPGSKLGVSDMALSVVDLVKIDLDLRQRRAHAAV